MHKKHEIILTKCLKNIQLHQANTSIIMQLQVIIYKYVVQVYQDVHS